MDASLTDQHYNEVFTALTGGLSPLVASFFDLIERVRYASKDRSIPHLPIGTAQLIDTLELFFLRLQQDGEPVAAAPRLLDWAVSVKIVPLFDSDVVAPETLKDFANSLASPFDIATKRQLMEIVAAGMYFVE
jgi:5-methylcytosine-specific restriction protein B